MSRSVVSAHSVLTQRFQSSLWVNNFPWFNQSEAQWAEQSQLTNQRLVCRRWLACVAPGCDVCWVWPPASIARRNEVWQTMNIWCKTNVWVVSLSLWFVGTVRNFITWEAWALREALGLFCRTGVELDAEHTCDGKANKLTTQRRVLAVALAAPC